MKKLHLIALAPLALAACKGSGDTITNNSNSAATSAVPDAVIVNGVTYVRAGSTGFATPAAATPTPVPPVAVPTVAPAIAPPVSPPVDPANLEPTQPTPGDGHGG
jgi:hypothetical protein